MAGDPGPKRLYRSSGNRIIGGVLGGIGEYLDVDPVAIRVLYILLAALTGVLPMLLAYIILIFVMPTKA